MLTTEMEEGHVVEGLPPCRKRERKVSYPQQFYELLYQPRLHLTMLYANFYGFQRLFS